MNRTARIAGIVVLVCILGANADVPAPGDCPYTGVGGLGLRADLNEDCYVNIVDFAMFVADWLACTDLENSECGQWFENRRGHRFFVTKVYPGQGVLSQEDFEQLADAGFTTVVNRWKVNVPGYAQYAAAAGLDSMSWDTGLVNADSLGVAHTVTHEGLETQYSVPYSPEAWLNRRQTLQSRALLSLTSPRFTGVLLDFEIYDANKTNGFAESYDDASFVNFLTEKGQSVPDPLTAPAQRRGYLSGLGLDDDFIAWQYDLVAAEIVQLRQTVDAINPNFLIGVYGWGPLIEAVMENVATASAPVLLINAATYGRDTYSGGYDTTRPDRPALKWSLMTNAEAAQLVPGLSYPAIYLGGHNPQAVGTGDAYKFTVRQAYNSIAYGPGYWIWTEWDVPAGWGRQDWIDALMAYFKLAHTALDLGDFTWASREPVQIADPCATTPLVILTANQLDAVTAWDPITGMVTTGGTPGPTWTTTAIGDVDAIAGDERVDIENGWILIFDPATDIQLLRFFVGLSQIKLQLVSPP